MDQAGLIAARALVYFVLLVGTGIPLYLSTRAALARPSRVCANVIAGLAVLAAILSLWWMGEATAVMAAVSLSDLDAEMVSSIAAVTPLGDVLKWRLVALGLLGVAALARAPNAVLAVFGAAALAGLAFVGHAGASAGQAGILHRLADIFHLLAAACWLGALAVFVASMLRRYETDGSLVEPLQSFATTGTAITVILVVTGVINFVLISGDAVDFSSPWVVALGAKLVLFAAMIGLAATNRWLLVPALGQGESGARRSLRRALAVELACGIAIVALVAVIGTLDPQP